MTVAAIKTASDVGSNILAMSVRAELPWSGVRRCPRVAAVTVEGNIDLRELTGRLANRSLRGRTEADVQSDVRMLLLASGLNLTEGDVLDVKLEAQLADRRRIDIEMGRTSSK